MTVRSTTPDGDDENFHEVGLALVHFHFPDRLNSCLQSFKICYGVYILSEVCFLYSIGRLIVGVLLQRTGFDPVRLGIRLEVDNGTVGLFYLGVLQLSCL